MAKTILQGPAPGKGEGDTKEDRGLTTSKNGQYRREKAADKDKSLQKGVGKAGPCCLFGTPTTSQTTGQVRGYTEKKMKYFKKFGYQ